MTRPLVFAVLACLCSGCFLANRYVANRLAREEHQLNRSELHRVYFCSLPEHAGKYVRTKALYSGIEEYWSLTPLSPCESSFADSASVWPELDDYAVYPWQVLKSKRLRKVHDEYWKYDAIVDIEGYFETGDDLGYGHVNASASQFVITYLRGIRIIRKDRDGT